MARKKILWLTSWYPNKTDLFDGDFIQRHARAAAIHNDVHVLFVTTGNTQQNVEEEFNYATGLTEQIIYYKGNDSFFKWYNKQFQYFNHFKNAIKNYINKNGLPSVVHIQIPWKAGLLGIWLKKNYGIPYLVTEHWGIYNKVEKYNFHTRSIITRKAIKYIFQQAHLFISVSKFLGEGVNRLVVKKKYVIMPNVVDTTLFHPVERSSDETPFTFIHVSNGAAIKNIEGIIDAFSDFIDQARTENTRLLIIGTKEPELKKRAEKKGTLNKQIFFLGEMPYAEVAKKMKHADVLVLFSHMENSPCVIGEALCCGIPVIATNVGGIPELADESNSILIEPKNTTGLTNAFIKIINEYKKYDKSGIAAAAVKKFSYDAVSLQFQQIYSAMIIKE